MAPDAVEPEEQDENESEAEPAADETDDPDEPAIEGDENEEPESDPETPVIAAPRSWDAAERALFETLTSEAKQIIAARADQDSKAVSRAIQEANEAKKSVTKEVEQIAALRNELQAVLPKAEQAFANRWANVDWEAWADQDPAAAQAGFFRYQREQAEVARLQETNRQASTIAQRKFYAEESEKLKTLAPELADPAKGSANKQALAKYLLDQGADANALETISAQAVSVAWKAYQYDQLKAGVKPHTIKPAQAKPTVKPTSAAPVRSPQAEASRVADRFAQSGGVDDAIALLNARSARR